MLRADFADSLCRSPRHRPPPIACLFTVSMNSLADVEVQLCAQFLGLDGILSLAQCSKQYARAIRSPFAFKHAVLPMSTLDVTAVPALTGPVRYAAAALRWLVPLDREGGAAFDDDIALLLSFPMRVSELDCTDFAYLSSQQWRQILSAPSMQNLLVLTIAPLDGADRADSVALELAAKLPRLHTLRVRSVLRCGAFAALASAPSLTSLSALDTNRIQEDESCLPFLSKCPLLTELEILSPEWTQQTCRALFLGGSNYLAANLHSLSLHDFDAEFGENDRLEGQAREFAEYFETLAALRTLTLGNVNSINTLLPHVFRARALRLIRIVLTCSPSRLARSTSVPSAGILQPLLAGAPELSCHILYADSAALHDHPVFVSLSSAMKPWARRFQLLATVA